jgi:hypothetical protein
MDQRNDQHSEELKSLRLTARYSITSWARPSNAGGNRDAERLGGLEIDDPI